MTQVLNLANNAIDEISNLNNLNLFDLNLEGNRIQTIRGLREQVNLHTLNVAKNRLRK